MKVVARPLPPPLLANCSRLLLSPPPPPPPRRGSSSVSSRAMPEETPFVPASESELRNWLVRRQTGGAVIGEGKTRRSILSFHFFVRLNLSFLSPPSPIPPRPQVLQRRRPGQVRPFAGLEDDRRPPSRGRARGERAVPSCTSSLSFFSSLFFLVFSSSHHLHGPPPGPRRPRARHPLLR